MKKDLWLLVVGAMALTSCGPKHRPNQVQGANRHSLPLKVEYSTTGDFYSPDVPDTTTYVPITDFDTIKDCDCDTLSMISDTLGKGDTLVLRDTTCCGKYQIINNGGVVIIGDHNVIGDNNIVGDSNTVKNEVNQTEIINNNNISNSGSGSVNVNNSNNVNNNNSGNQNNTQTTTQTTSVTTNRPNTNNTPKKKKKQNTQPVVVQPQENVVVQPQNNCDECEEHIQATVRLNARITTSDNAGQTQQSGTSYRSTFHISSGNGRQYGQ